MKIPRYPFAMAGIAAATAVVAPSVIVVSALTLGKNHGTAFLPRLWAKMTLASCGVKVAVRGMDRFDHRANYVMVSNHVSLMDAPAIVSLAPQKIRFVAKRSLFYVPVFGQALLAAGNIPVDRARAGSAARRLSEAAHRVGREISLLYFPEGTRSPDGTLQEFKKGAAVMAIQAQVSVLPIAVAGTRDVLPKGSRDVHPGTVGVAFGEPIEVAGRSLRDRDELNRLLHAAVEKLLPEAEEARRTGK